MKTEFRAIGTAALALALFAFAGAASATEDKSLEELLTEKGYITQEELDSLRVDSTTPPESKASEPEANAASENEKKASSGPQIKVNHKGLAVTSEDGRFKMAFGGRLQFDAAGFIEDRSHMGAGTEMRRARIKTFGTVYENWDYKLEVNFDPDLRVPLTDAWLSYDGYKPFDIPLKVMLGHQKVPFSQQSMTSSNWQVFQERGLGDAFIDNQENGRRRLGGTLQSYGDHWNVAWGVFAEGIGPASNRADEDFGTAGRVVVAPIVGPTKVLTFDGSVYYRNFNGASVLRFSARPEAHIASTKMVDTGILPNDHDNLMFNFGASMVLGPVHAQAEYTGSKLNRRDTAAGTNTSDLYFSSYYVQAGWFLTGESRNYDIKSGKYKRPSPARKIGAWEVAARWSFLDLQDRDIRGGRENDLTVGLNWWVNKSVMFRFNYVSAWTDPTSFKAKDGAGFNEHVSAFTGRAQIVF